jgi:uncharacterized protein YggT (Ycf19 family)
MTIAYIAWLAVTIIGALSCLIFVIGYHVKTQGTWRYYPMGQHLMGFIVALVVPFALLIVALLGVHPSPWIWVGALAGVDVFLIQRLWLLFARKWRSTGSEPSEDTVTRTRTR